MQTPKKHRCVSAISSSCSSARSSLFSAMPSCALPCRSIFCARRAPRALFGGVSALSFAPMIVLSLLGGVLADRASKRKIMVAMDFGVALLCALFLLLMDGLPVAAATAAFLMLLYRRVRALSTGGAGEHAGAFARRGAPARQRSREYGVHARRSPRPRSWWRAVRPLWAQAPSLPSAPSAFSFPRLWNCFCAYRRKKERGRRTRLSPPDATLRKAGATSAVRSLRSCV